MSNWARLSLVGEMQEKVVSNVALGNLLKIVIVPQNWTSLLERINQSSKLSSQPYMVFLAKVMTIPRVTMSPRTQLKMTTTIPLPMPVLPS